MTIEEGAKDMKENIKKGYYRQKIQNCVRMEAGQSNKSTSVGVENEGKQGSETHNSEITASSDNSQDCSRVSSGEINEGSDIHSNILPDADLMSKLKEVAKKESFYLIPISYYNLMFTEVEVLRKKVKVLEDKRKYWEMKFKNLNDAVLNPLKEMQ